jgi:arsenite methyltransferase
MTGRASIVAGALRRVRVAVKRFGYSGWGRDRWQQPERVVAELRLRPGDRVADLGSGGGYFTFRLARAVGPAGVVYAVDTDTELLAALGADAAGRKVGNVVTVAARPDDPRLPEPVDLGILVNAYHHLPDRPAWFATLARQLRPGGRVAVLEARPAGLLRRFGHATSAETIRSELEAAGYAQVAEVGDLQRQCFLVFEHRQVAEG